MNEYDLVYMAGFFDGEGCISVSRSRKKTNNKLYLKYYITLTVGQSGEQGKKICEWIQDIFGGKVFESHRNRHLFDSSLEWVWAATQKPHIFLKQILPYLKIKKKQAELAIEFQKQSNKYIGKSRPSDIEKIEKYSYYETVKREMSFLNNRKVKEVSWMVS